MFWGRWLFFFLTSLWFCKLDIHMEYYSALKMSKTYLFTISKSKHNMMTMTVHGNAALWLAHFMTLAMLISIRCGTKPGERQRNAEYFRIQDRGKFVKCDVISLASILKMASFWPVLMVVLKSYQREGQPRWRRFKTLTLILTLILTLTLRLTLKKETNERNLEKGKKN